jgi:hypothetical protein
MRPYDQLTYHLDNELIGRYARDILELAEQYGRPHASSGLPVFMPAPFELAVTSDDLERLIDSPEAFLMASSLRGAVFALYGAVDYSWIEHKQQFVITPPFDELPEWAKPEHDVVIDPRWLPFQRAALVVVHAALDDLAERGMIRYVVREPGSLTA